MSIPAAGNSAAQLLSDEIAHLRAENEQLARERDEEREEVVRIARDNIALRAQLDEAVRVRDATQLALDSAIADRDRSWDDELEAALGEIERLRLLLTEGGIIDQHDEMTRLREALRFYAKRWHIRWSWDVPSDGATWWGTDSLWARLFSLKRQFWVEQGDHARAALGEE